MASEKAFKSPYKVASPTVISKPYYPKIDVAVTALNSTGATAELIYQVPAEKVFVLEGFQLYASHDGGNNDADVKLNVSGIGTICYFVTAETSGAGVGWGFGMSQSLPRGLRIPAGARITIFSGMNTLSVIATIFGYLTDEKDLSYTSN